MIYGSSLSWVSPTKPATKEIYPARTFDRLVGDGTGRKLDRSILDEVKADSQNLRPKISRDDKVKLAEYLDSIRDIEKRIEHAANEERLEGWRPTLAQPDMPRPANELPQNIPDHMKLMLDLTVLAFQMDKTRIATLMLNNDLSQMNFKFVEGVHGALHLDITHHKQNQALATMHLKTNPGLLGLKVAAKVIVPQALVGGGAMLGLAFAGKKLSNMITHEAGTGGVPGALRKSFAEADGVTPVSSEPSCRPWSRR